jgi:hypothetical protein
MTPDTFFFSEGDSQETVNANVSLRSEKDQTKITQCRALQSNEVKPEECNAGFGFQLLSH